MAAASPSPAPVLALAPAGVPPLPEVPAEDADDLAFSWDDPQLREDALPQPFRFVSELVQSLVADALVGAHMRGAQRAIEPRLCAAVQPQHRLAAAPAALAVAAVTGCREGRLVALHAGGAVALLSARGHALCAPLSLCGEGDVFKDVAAARPLLGAASRGAGRVRVAVALGASALVAELALDAEAQGASTPQRQQHLHVIATCEVHAPALETDANFAAFQGKTRDEAAPPPLSRVTALALSPDGAAMALTAENCVVEAFALRLRDRSLEAARVFRREAGAARPEAAPRLSLLSAGKAGAQALMLWQPGSRLLQRYRLGAALLRDGVADEEGGGGGGGAADFEWEFDHALSALRSSSDGTFTAIGLANGAVHVLRNSGSMRFVPCNVRHGGGGEVRAVALSADGRMLASLGADRCVHIFALDAERRGYQLLARSPTLPAEGAVETPPLLEVCAATTGAVCADSAKGWALLLDAQSGEARGVLRVADERRGPVSVALGEGDSVALCAGGEIAVWKGV